jgi:hypothetical protein
MSEASCSLDNEEAEVPSMPRMILGMGLEWPLCYHLWYK